MSTFFSLLYVPTFFSPTSLPLSTTLPITFKSSTKFSRPCSFHSHSPSCSAVNGSPKKATFHHDKPCQGAEILVEALERKGVQTVFAYPGGASMHIHKFLNRSNIRKVLPRHEQGGIFAAEGYAKSTGKPGVCIVTSGPGATNLVTGLQDAMLDSVPLIAITGQVPLEMIGTGAFQDTPIVEVRRSITKHCYLVKRVEDIPRIIDEAFFIATSGRPGPVLIDVPKDVQAQVGVPNWEQSMQLPLQFASLPKPIEITDLEEIVRMISESKKPVLYTGGGCVDSSYELHRFSELTKIPLATTFMGLGVFPPDRELSLHMIGMHGTVYANYAVEFCDLLLAFGVRFDDRVTGKVEAFASRAKIVHIDIDSSEIGKKKVPCMSVCGDVKMALQGMNKILENKSEELKLDFQVWSKELNEQKDKFPLSFPTYGTLISPQYAIQTLCKMTQGNAIITTGVGQHQMWAAQFYKFSQPRRWISSGGLGSMGFGLPAAIGASIANPDAIVVDIDGDGSFIMNVQELATIRAENLPVKILLLNNQHLGMVIQWEERFFDSKQSREDAFLGDPSKQGKIFPDMLLFAEACGIPGARVAKTENLHEAIQRMIETPGPYLLEVIIPVEAIVLPMIPSGGTFNETILK